MEKSTTTRLFLFALCMAALVLACFNGTLAAAQDKESPPAGDQEQELVAGLQLTKSLPLPANISPATPFITALCINGSCNRVPLIVTNGTAASVRTVTNVGQNTFALQCVNNFGIALGPKLTLPPNYVNDGMACPQGLAPFGFFTGVALFIQCPVEPCVVGWVP